MKKVIALLCVLGLAAIVKAQGSYVLQSYSSMIPTPEQKAALAAEKAAAEDEAERAAVLRAASVIAASAKAATEERKLLEKFPNWTLKDNAYVYNAPWKSVCQSKTYTFRAEDWDSILHLYGKDRAYKKAAIEKASPLIEKSTNLAFQAQKKLKALSKENKNFELVLYDVILGHQHTVEVALHPVDQYHAYRTLENNFKALQERIEQIKYEPLKAKVKGIINHKYYFPQYKPEQLVSLGEMMGEIIKYYDSAKGTNFSKDQDQFRPLVSYYNNL